MSIGKIKKFKDIFLFTAITILDLTSVKYFTKRSPFEFLISRKKCLISAG